MAPEVAVGLPVSPASDIWALGCSIYRIRSGDDLFFDYDTNSPEYAPRQIEKALGPLPEEWRKTRFDENGLTVVDGGTGKLFWSLDETRPLEDRVRAIFDEPPSLSINDQGEAVEFREEGVKTAMFDEDVALTLPYSPAFSSMVWKPTAVRVAGTYMIGYSEETDGILEAFPRILAAEGPLLLDFLSKVSAYDSTKRPSAEELAAPPWLSLPVSSK